MDKNLSKLVKILVSEQIALTFFGQVFVFLSLINKKTCWSDFY